VKWSWLVVLGLLACSEKPEPKTTAERSQSASPSAETMTVEEIPEPPVERPNVTIERVTVANPLVIEGQARTFENNVMLRARTADGTVVAEGFATATGEMGQHSPYRGTLWLTRAAGARVVVEAFEHSAKDGSEINMARMEKAFDVAAVDVALDFPDAQCTAMKAHTRRMPKSISMARLLVEALLAGPTAEESAGGATSAFPEGSAVRSVNLRDGVLTVDFNERLQNVGGACRAGMIRDSVTSTLRRLPSVKSVVLTAGGSKELALQP